MKSRHFCLCFFVGLLFLPACDRTEKKPSAPPTPKLVVAIPTYPGFAIPYLAEKRELFQGVKVELKQIDDAAVINSGMMRGDIDACFTSVDAFVLAAAAGVEAKAVLLSDESLGADGIVAKNSIRSLADLQGKKVAANLGWPGHFFLLYNLRQNQIPFDKVPITNMDADKAGAAFVSGNLDAAVTWEPWLTKAISGGNAHMLVSTKTLPGVILDVCLVSKDALAEHPDAVQAFVDGYYRALALHAEQEEVANSIMAEALGLQVEEFAAMCEGLRFIQAKEAAELLQTGGGVPNLFATAAGIWSEAKDPDTNKPIINKPLSPKDHVTSKFVERFLEK